MTRTSSPVHLLPRTRTAPMAPRLLAAALATAVVAALTLAPRRLVAPARGAFLERVDLAVPTLAGLPSLSVDTVLNALLFVPFGAAVALLLGRWWLLAIPAGFGLSAAVEFAQEGIPGRVPDLADVLWNGAGSLIGAVLAASAMGLWWLVRRARRGLRRDGWRAVGR
ncbi:hypothetical protein CVS47_02387 [Microbacterium lemovicicum]|uniref:VanZ-like domain-containing protein n=1 Tax=Microbacterium lemovicicum TaxID=1072463 RepID=A0A3S9WCG5_9MICO|nr:VanZ family protein [Microbacterium lemovicicum]AZS37741.1 hypothetical protein CVS47_02387 [Microbacterium lemovicicum]